MLDKHVMVSLLHRLEQYKCCGNLRNDYLPTINFNRSNRPVVTATKTVVKVMIDDVR